MVDLDRKPAWRYKKIRSWSKAPN